MPLLIPVVRLVIAVVLPATLTLVAFSWPPSTASVDPGATTPGATLPSVCAAPGAAPVPDGAVSASPLVAPVRCTVPAVPLLRLVIAVVLVVIAVVLPAIAVVLALTAVLVANSWLPLTASVEAALSWPAATLAICRSAPAAPTETTLAGVAPAKRVGRPADRRARRSGSRPCRPIPRRVRRRPRSLAVAPLPMAIAPGAVPLTVAPVPSAIELVAAAAVAALLPSAIEPTSPALALSPVEPRPSMLLPPMVMPLSVASVKPPACWLHAAPGVRTAPVVVRTSRPIGAPLVAEVTMPPTPASSPGPTIGRPVSGVKMPVTSGVRTEVSRDGGRLAPVHALTRGRPGAATTGVRHDKHCQYRTDGGRTKWYIHQRTDGRTYTK